MLHLIIDTSSKKLTVSLCEETTICAEFTDDFIIGTAEKLLPIIDSLFKAAKKERTDLNTVIVTVGPGSFTGVRIGLSTAKGIGDALDITVLGVSALESVAMDMPRPCIVALDTKRNDFYTQQFFDNGTTKPTTSSLEEIINMGFPVITDTPEAFKDTSVKLLPYPENFTLNLLKTALQQARVSTSDTDPIYIRNAEVTIKQK